MRKKLLLMYSLLITIVSITLLILLLNNAKKDYAVTVKEPDDNNIQQSNLSTNTTKENETELTDEEHKRKYSEDYISLNIKKETIVEIMCLRMGFDKTNFEISDTEDEYCGYRLIFTGEELQTVESNTVVLNPETGHIYDEVSSTYLANILYDISKEIIQDDEIKNLLMTEIIKELPDNSKLFIFSSEAGDVLASISKKVDGKYESLIIYKVNPLTGDVYNYDTKEYVGTIKDD